MEPVKRIMVNTVAQYIKALVNICLSLYSTRLVLSALSMNDYGIYSVVAGLVAMLGFMTNALVITTQRYISYCLGSGDTAYVRKLFVNSLFLHEVIGLGLAIVLLCPQDWLMNHVLNIETDRIQAASTVYGIMVFMLFVTVVTAPFKALFVARENIVYISVVEVCDGILKLLLAASLTKVAADRLLVYAGMMSLILGFNFLAFVLYAKTHFAECSVWVRFRDIDRGALLRLVAFAGWTTYGMGAVATRNQGTAVILNHFFGTVVNAAYGIAFQVQSAVSFLSTSVLNAMNPQIMKAEGMGDRERAVMLAERESKYSTLLMSLVVVPLIIEMPSVLDFWLEEVPEGAVMFCRFVLFTFLCDQMTYGLHTLNQALGRIRLYTLWAYTPKLLTLPLIWCVLRWGGGVQMAMGLYLLLELLVSLFRLPYLKYTAGVGILHFLTQVILPLLLLCSVLALIGIACTLWLGAFPFWGNMAIMLFVGTFVVWFVILDNSERAMLRWFVNFEKRKVR